MNYYERIQKSIDYIENNIENNISIEDAAKQAFMSFSNYYRLFFSIVGYTVKEYIRLRRISLSAEQLHNSDMRILDIAILYGFSSGDTFSRAFRKETGFLPSAFRKNEILKY